MANPKRKHSNERTRTRRAHDALTVPQAGRCSNCGAGILPHRVCMKCGFYRGRQVLTIKSKVKASEQDK